MQNVAYLLPRIFILQSIGVRTRSEVVRMNGAIATVTVLLGAALTLLAAWALGVW